MPNILYSVTVKVRKDGHRSGARGKAPFAAPNPRHLPKTFILTLELWELGPSGPEASTTETMVASTMPPRGRIPRFVIPAQAGIQFFFWSSEFPSQQKNIDRRWHVFRPFDWIPACAGMTNFFPWNDEPSSLERGAPP